MGRLFFLRPWVACRSELVKKWGLAPPPYAYDRENHANARCLSPFFHKLSAKDRLFGGAKGGIQRKAKSGRAIGPPRGVLHPVGCWG